MFNVHTMSLIRLIQIQIGIIEKKTLNINLFNNMTNSNLQLGSIWNFIISNFNIKGLGYTLIR